MEGHCSHNLKSTLKAPDKIACVYGSEICRNGAKFRVNCMQECDRELYGGTVFESLLKDDRNLIVTGGVRWQEGISTVQSS